MICNCLIHGYDRSVIFSEPSLTFTWRDFLKGTTVWCLALMKTDLVISETSGKGLFTHADNLKGTLDNILQFSFSVDFTYQLN